MDYARHYERLIHRAQLRDLADGAYSERHHIVPKCLGGQDDSDNLVRLTAEEHFVAHQLLAKMFPTKPKLTFAAWAMCQGRNGTNKRYGWLRRAFAQRLSETTKGVKTGNVPEWRKERLRGPKSEAHKAALSAARRSWGYSREAIEKAAEANRGRPRSEECRRKIVQSSIGKIISDEARAKMRAAKLGVKRGAAPQVTCPHCGKIGGGGTMSRWHFDNCKERKHGAQE